MGIFINGMGLRRETDRIYPGRYYSVRGGGRPRADSKRNNCFFSMYVFNIYNFISFTHSLTGCPYCAKCNSRMDDPH